MREARIFRESEVLIIYYLGPCFEFFEFKQVWQKVAIVHKI